MAAAVLAVVVAVPMVVAVTEVARILEEPRWLVPVVPVLS
jgi:hypothetical protein